MAHPIMRNEMKLNVFQSILILAILQLGIVGYAFSWDASEYAGGVIEKAHFETQEEWSMVRDSCKEFSADLIGRFEALGYDAYYVDVLPYAITPENKGMAHRVVVMNSTVYGNGAFYPYPFPIADLVMYGAYSPL